MIFSTDINSLKYKASPTFRNAINYVDDYAGWFRYRDIVDVINEEAEGRNKVNAEFGEHQQKNVRRNERHVVSIWQ